MTSIRIFETVVDSDENDVLKLYPSLLDQLLQLEHYALKGPNSKNFKAAEIFSKSSISFLPSCFTERTVGNIGNYLFLAKYFVYV